MLLLLITALLGPGSKAQGDLSAQIHTVGTSGSISLSTDTWTLRTNLSGTCGPVTISVHEFPMLYGWRRDPCDEGSIGRPRYNVTMSGVGQVVVDSGVRYDGAALVVRTCGQSVCANLQDASQRTWQVKLRSVILGQVYFVQSLAQTVAVLDLAVLEGVPASSASLLLSSTCRPEDGRPLASAELGSRHMSARSRLELGNVTMMPYLLVQYDQSLVCAEVKAVAPKEAASAISMSGVSGSFTFKQESPFHPTHITIQLWGLRGSAAQYGVHALPIPRGQDACNVTGTGTLWDPLEVGNQSAHATHSTWPLGDLSGRHGSLQGQDSLVAALLDWNLPLFGNNSIVGRSVVLSQAGGAPLACGTLRALGEAYRAMAVFRTGVIGRILFQQPQNDPYGDLSVYVELSHGALTVSRGHNWHIHSLQLQSESESCTAAGGHFNPYKVPVTGNYSEACTAERPLWCEAGDYASKHRSISFLTPAPARYVFTEASSMLSGPDSILGRSVVIHGADGASARLACANILPHRQAEGRSRAWYGAGDAGGELRASQASDLEPTWVQIRLRGLRGLAGGFHIHLLPVDGARDDPCSNARVRGHFNPWGVQASTSPAAGSGSDDQYEVGDISGRRGALLSKDTVTEQYTDLNLPLTGQHSVLGRSLVIHYANGSRMQCASFLQETPSDGEWVRASAEFSGNISGRITLTQVVFPDGASGDTTILVSLQSSSGKTSGLDWLIPTEERRGEAYNPYDLPSQAGARCTAMRAQLCRVGDLKGKHGPVAPGDEVLLTDPNLPLAGDYTVIGRSLLVGSDALESLILPDVAVTFLYFQRMTSFNRSAFRESLSLILNVAAWKVTLLPEGPSNNPACRRVGFFIIGFNNTAALSTLRAQEPLGAPCPDPSGSVESGGDCRAAAGGLVPLLLLLQIPLILD